MARLPRINIKLAVAAICIIAGIIILWRTFSSTRPTQVATEPTPIVTQEPTKRANAELIGVTPPVAQPTSSAYPIGQAVPTASLVPTVTPVVPTAILPTSVLANPSPSIDVSPSVVVAPSPSPAVQLTATIAPSPSSLATTIVPSQVPSATTINTTSTETLPTAVPTTAVATSVIGAATATQTITPTVQPTPSVVTVIYRVEGTVSSAYIGYADATGKITDIVVALPWSITIQTSSDADMYVDVVASLPNEQDSVISCAILINGASTFDGKPLPFDQDTSANGGVTCDRSLS